MPDVDVTPAVHDLIRCLVMEWAYRGGIEDPHLMSLTELLATRSWDPKMQTAIAVLADFDDDRITCIRTGESDG